MEVVDRYILDHQIRRDGEWVTHPESTLASGNVTHGEHYTFIDLKDMIHLLAEGDSIQLEWRTRDLCGMMPAEAMHRNERK